MPLINTVKKFREAHNIDGAIYFNKADLDKLIKKSNITDDNMIADLYGFFHIDWPTEN